MRRFTLPYEAGIRSVRRIALPERDAESNDAYIRDVPLLARLPDADLQALASRGRIRRFAAGAVVFREGDAGDGLYVLVEGRVRLTMLSGAGGEAILASLGRGECLGEMALFDGKPRSTTATAAEATKTFMVSRDDFVAWVSERPAAALALLETLSLRLRRANEHMTDLVFLDLSQRLAKELVRLAAADGAHRAARIQVTQSELASMLGVSRESVNKQLNQFAREGWIKLSRGAVTILDATALRQFA
jgi:CRP/FNR family cyclic AMP-dependent transcriptional regulator